MIEEVTDCLIIGTGISGLAAARVLQQSNLNVLLVDKARGVGGRMSTRRFDNTLFDHGAQYFTAKTPEFAQVLADWHEQGLIRPWFEQLRSLDEELGPKYPRYCVPGGMSKLPKALSQDCNVDLNTRVLRLEGKNDIWRVETEKNRTYYARSIVLTAPMPQTLEILKSSQISINATNYAALQQITYHKCIAILLSFATDIKLPEPGGITMPEGGVVAWLADNLQKEVAKGSSAVTVHCSSEFSEKYFDAANDQIEQRVLDSLDAIIKNKPQAMQIHRWRYASPQETYSKNYLALETPIPALICGEAFGGPRVEGAYLSGNAAAQYLLKNLQTASEHL